MPSRKTPEAGPPGSHLDSAIEEQLADHAPLAARMRPRRLDEIVGRPHLLGPGAPRRALIEADRLSSIILWGPPGTGKTTLARVVASTTNRRFAEEWWQFEKFRDPER